MNKQYVIVTRKDGIAKEIYRHHDLDDVLNVAENGPIQDRLFPITIERDLGFGHYQVLRTIANS